MIEAQDHTVDIVGVQTCQNFVDPGFMRSGMFGKGLNATFGQPDQMGTAVSRYGDAQSQPFIRQLIDYACDIAV